MVQNAPKIISRVVARKGTLAPAVANEVLSWQFTQRDKKRVAQLLEKKRESTITPDERQDLDTYIVFSDILDLLHSRALLALKKNEPPVLSFGALGASP